MVNEGRWTQVGIVSWGKHSIVLNLFRLRILINIKIKKQESDVEKVNIPESTLALRLSSLGFRRISEKVENISNELSHVI